MFTTLFTTNKWFGEPTLGHKCNFINYGGATLFLFLDLRQHFKDERNLIDCPQWYRYLMFSSRIQYPNFGQRRLHPFGQFVTRFFVMLISLLKHYSICSSNWYKMKSNFMHLKAFIAQIGCTMKPTGQISLDKRKIVAI